MAVWIDMLALRVLGRLLLWLAVVLSFSLGLAWAWDHSDAAAGPGRIDQVAR